MDNFRILKVLKTDPLWYLSDEFWNKAESLIFSESNKEEREDFIKSIAQMLEKENVLLGNNSEGFNDGDRYNIKTKNWKTKPNTIVIHHTSTSSNVSLPYLNALGLLRLYVPIYRKGFNKTSQEEYKPVSSGHFDNSNKQVFYGYHYLIRENGNVEQLLKKEYTGFHAGDYKTNVNSFGIAISGDYTEELPSESSIRSVIKIISRLKTDFSIQHILGHQEVTHNEKLVDTQCPGKTWEEWKYKVKAGYT